MLPLMRNEWDAEHEACADVFYVRTLKVSLKGGDSTWI